MAALSFSIIDITINFAVIYDTGIDTISDYCILLFTYGQPTILTSLRRVSYFPLRISQITRKFVFITLGIFTSSANQCCVGDNLIGISFRSFILLTDFFDIPSPFWCTLSCRFYTGICRQTFIKKFYRNFIEICFTGVTINSICIFSILKIFIDIIWTTVLW